MTDSAIQKSEGSRWLQLVLGVVAMMAISSPQYVWTLFTKPYQEVTGASLPVLQWTATILIVLQTWLSPLQGALIERFGPRLLVMTGCVLSGLGWVLGAYAKDVLTLYATYGLLCGVGTGIVYVGVIGHMVRWFPDRRGFAAGMAAAGYGFGAMLTTFPISDMLKASGYQHTLIVFGFILGGVGALAAAFLKEPSEGYRVASVAARPHVTKIDYAPGAMLKTPTFWLLFIMMTMMSTGGLMVILNFATFSREFGITDSVMVWGFAALPFALTLDRITNGLTRPFFGWLSDRIGRENTMVIAFAGEALAIFLMLNMRHDPLAYVLLSGVVFFGWGEIFSLFPSILTDTFGTKHATANYGFLYMAQGVGSVLGGPFAAFLHDQTGSWLPVFGVIITMDLLTAFLALVALKPLRRSWIASGSAA